MNDAGARELVGELAQVDFIARVKCHGECAGLEPRRRRFAGGMDRLGDLRSVGEIGPDYHVVNDVQVLGAVGVAVHRENAFALTVNAS